MTEYLTPTVPRQEADKRPCRRREDLDMKYEGINSGALPLPPKLGLKLCSADVVFVPQVGRWPIIP